MKKILIALILTAMVSPAMAVEKETKLGMIDLTSVVDNLRASVLINSDAELFYGGQVPVVTVMSRVSGVEYVNLNTGLIYSSVDSKSDFMVSLGVRLDSYIWKIGESYDNVKTAKLPAVEIGPFLSYGFNDWMWGGMLSVRLGGQND